MNWNSIKQSQGLKHDLREIKPSCILGHLFVRVFYRKWEYQQVVNEIGHGESHLTWSNTTRCRCIKYALLLELTESMTFMRWPLRGNEIFLHFNQLLMTALWFMSLLHKVIQCFISFPLSSCACPSIWSEPQKFQREYSNHVNLSFERTSLQ